MNVRFCGNRPHSISDALKCIGSASDPAWELIVGGSRLWCSPLITRAHSLPWNNEPRNSSFSSGIRLFAAEFDVFYSNNYFFTENDLKVALLQVKSSLRLFRPPLTQTQRGLQDH